MLLNNDMAGQKTCYFVSDPLECLFHARDLVFENKGRRCIVVLPRHIEPDQFEAYMLEGEGSVSGVEVHKISSLPRNMLSRIPEGKKLKRVDQVALSEHFEGDYTRGVTRSLLNSVLELRLSYFDLPYLEELLASRPNPEYGMLLKVFKKYETFLKTNGLSDDADFKKALVDVLSDPDHTSFVQRSVIPVNAVVIFAGFTEYTSADLMLMEALSKNAQDSYIIGPDLMVDGLDYSRVLEEELKRIGFDIQRLESTNKDRTKLFELKSPSEEAYFISSSLSGASSLGGAPGAAASPHAGASRGGCRAGAGRAIRGDGGAGARRGGFRGGGCGGKDRRGDGGQCGCDAARGRSRAGRDAGPRGRGACATLGGGGRGERAARGGGGAGSPCGARHPRRRAGDGPPSGAAGL